MSWSLSLMNEYFLYILLFIILFVQFLYNRHIKEGLFKKAKKKAKKAIKKTGEIAKPIVNPIVKTVLPIIPKPVRQVISNTTNAILDEVKVLLDVDTKSVLKEKREEARRRAEYREKLQADLDNENQILDDLDNTNKILSYKLENETKSLKKEKLISSMKYTGATVVKKQSEKLNNFKNNVF